MNTVEVAGMDYPVSEFAITMPDNKNLVMRFVALADSAIEWLFDDMTDFFRDLVNSLFESYRPDGHPFDLWCAYTDTANGRPVGYTRWVVAQIEHNIGSEFGRFLEALGYEFNIRRG